MMRISVMLILALFKFSHCSFGAEDYSLKLYKKNNAIGFELWNATNSPIYIPADISHVRVNSDSVIFEIMEYDPIIRYNMFVPPVAEKVQMKKSGKYKTNGVEIPCNRRYFLRAFKISFEEYLKIKKINSPYINTFNEYEREYSFLIEGFFT